MLSLDLLLQWHHPFSRPLGQRAEPRPARRSQGRADGRRGGHLEPAQCSPRPRPLTEFAGQDQLRPGLHRATTPSRAATTATRSGTSPTRRSPTLKTAYVCPASQSDVSVYQNLLFVSGEELSARLDCGAEGVQDTVSTDRLRGIRIFDITDIAHPENVGNVQTCRGSHTHTVLVDPKDTENVYVYISGSSSVRSPSELPGCVSATPTRTPTRRCSGSRSSRCRWPIRSRRPS